MVDRAFKLALADRCEAWEIAEFLGISATDFIEAFEEDVEVNYEELAEWIGLRTERYNDDSNDL